MLNRRSLRVGCSLALGSASSQYRSQGWGQQSSPSSGGGAAWGQQQATVGQGGGGWGSSEARGASSWGASANNGAGGYPQQQQYQQQPSSEVEVPEWMRSSTIIDEVNDFDNGDIFEHTVQFLRIIKAEQEKGSTGSSAEQTARVDLAVVGPRLSDLSVAECALLVTASAWPEEWLEDPQLSNIFETVRQRITSEASGLEGTEAACTFAAMNKDGGSLGLKKAISGASSSSTTEGALQYINRKLMKVIKAKINDIKEVSVILDIAVASKSIEDLGEFPQDLAAEWWPLLLRRFHAFERRKLLSADQAWRGFQAMNTMIESSQRADLCTLIYPVAFSLKEHTVKFASSAKGVAYPPSGVPELDHITRQCSNGLMVNGAEDFWWFLLQAADILSVNDFKTFFLSEEGHILTWLVAPNLTLRSETATLQSFVSQILNKAKVTEPLWLSVATEQFSTTAQGTALSFGDTVLLSALISRVSAAALKSASEAETALPFRSWTHDQHLHNFVLKAIEKIVIVSNDLDQAKLLYISDVLAGLHALFSSKLHGDGGETSRESNTGTLLQAIEAVFDEVLLPRALNGLYSRVYSADMAGKLILRLKKSPKLVEALLLSPRSSELIRILQGAESSSVNLKPKEPQPTFVISKGAVALAIQTMKPSQWLTLHPEAEFSTKLNDQLKNVLIKKTDVSLGNIDILGSLIIRHSISLKIDQSTCPKLGKLYPETVGSMKQFPDERLVAAMIDYLAERVIELVMNVSAGGAKAQGAMNTAKKFCFYMKLVQENPLFKETPLQMAVLGKPILLKSLADISKKASTTAPEWDDKMKDSEITALVKGANSTTSSSSSIVDSSSTTTGNSSPSAVFSGSGKSVAATATTRNNSSSGGATQQWGSAASANSQSSWGAAAENSSTNSAWGATSTAWGSNNSQQEAAGSGSNSSGWGSSSFSNSSTSSNSWSSAGTGQDGWGQQSGGGSSSGWGSSSSGSGGWGQ